MHFWENSLHCSKANIKPTPWEGILWWCKRKVLADLHCQCGWIHPQRFPGAHPCFWPATIAWMQQSDQIISHFTAQWEGRFWGRLLPYLPFLTRGFLATGWSFTHRASPGLVFQRRKYFPEIASLGVVRSSLQSLIPLVCVSDSIWISRLWELRSINLG